MANAERLRMSEPKNPNASVPTRPHTAPITPKRGISNAETITLNRSIDPLLIR